MLTHSPRTALITAAMLGLLSVGTLHAQTIYRVVGPDGKVSFTDKPPASNANAKSSQTDVSTASGSLPTLPFELRQVANKYPVTLYTTENCAPCASGRALLISRGIPFSEKTVKSTEDSEALRRISGTNSLPFLTIGSQQIKGFSDSEWTQFLNAAGYPKTSQLPANYRPAAASPLVQVQKPASVTKKEAAATEPESQTTAPPPAPVDNSSNPAGIQF